ncbi:hypothetical protein [Parabacteroides johnsonii]|uniref:hypothetical protein n=1 Tax=Parabacteroides johnsonii TaxID=387661 RepID=UPI003AB4E79D
MKTIEVSERAFISINEIREREEDMLSKFQAEIADTMSFITTSFMLSQDEEDVEKAKSTLVTLSRYNELLVDLSK